MFNRINFSGNIGAGSNTVKVYTYKTDDSIFTVLADDYFSDVADFLEVGDVIIVASSDDITHLYITENDTTIKTDFALAKQTYIFRALITGSTGTLTTTYKTVNTTNFPSLVYSVAINNNIATFDEATGELTFLRDCVIESDFTINTSSSGTAEVGIIPEIYVSDAWQTQAGRNQNVPNNQPTQLSVTGRREFQAGEKVRFNIAGESGTVELSSNSIGDGTLDTTVPAIIWIVAINLR